MIEHHDEGQPSGLLDTFGLPASGRQHHDGQQTCIRVV
jgi:hypothetical protein